MNFDEVRNASELQSNWSLCMPCQHHARYRVQFVREWQRFDGASDWSRHFQHFQVRVQNAKVHPHMIVLVRICMVVITSWTCSTQLWLAEESAGEGQMFVYPFHKRVKIFHVIFPFRVEVYINACRHMNTQSNSRLVGDMYKPHCTEHPTKSLTLTFEPYTNSYIWCLWWFAGLYSIIYAVCELRRMTNVIHKI